MKTKAKKKAKKQAYTQPSLFAWDNPSPADKHPLPRCTQPELRIGQTVHAGALVQTAIKTMLDFVVPWERADLERWVEEQEELLRIGMTDRSCYNELEWMTIMRDSVQTDSLVDFSEAEPF